MAIVVQNSMQDAFSVVDRNALGAAFAFLAPLESVFQFLEDTTTVQINFSLAAGTKEKTKEIFWASIRNAIFSGVVASVVCTVIAKSHNSLSTLLAPGAKHDQELYSGCTLLSDGIDVANAARPFFITYCWFVLPNMHQRLW